MIPVASISQPLSVITDAAGETLTIDDSVAGEKRLTHSATGGTLVLPDAAFDALGLPLADAVGLEEGPQSERVGFRRELDENDNRFVEYIEDNAGAVESGRIRIAGLQPNTVGINFLVSMSIAKRLAIELGTVAP